MKNLKKLILSAVVLTAILSVFSVVAYAADGEILADGCTVLVKADGTEGVAVVASYNKKGSLKKIVTEPVTEDNPALFKELEVGDKVMFLDSLKTMKPLAPSVTVTGAIIPTDTTDKENKRIQNTIYKVAVEKALVEALGENKGEDLTELQKVLHIHDWLIRNCMYQLDYIYPNLYTAYGAIVNGRAVCGGYTAAYADLLNEVGIKVSKKFGISPSGDQHEWSIVTVDGKNYYVDVAADDGSVDVSGGGGYYYFLVDAESFLKRGYQFNNNDNCTDTTYNECSLFRDGGFPLLWSESEQIYYFVDKNKVKTTDKTFSTEISKQTSETDQHPNSVIWTEDKQCLCFFIPSNRTRYGTLYLYNFEKDEYYKYEIEDASFYVIFSGLREKDNNLEVTRCGYINLTGSKYNIDQRYITFKEMAIPLPTNYEKRKVTFDSNYEGGTVSSCYYLNNYWTDGDGSFDAPTRENGVFRGWYTERNGGTKVENFEEISGDDVTLYAHWWGKWKITEEPTLTETGKAVHSLENNPEITEEAVIPNLSDKTVWSTCSVQTQTEMYTLYQSEYGDVKGEVTKKDTTPIYNYSITYSSKHDYYIFKWGTYGLFYIKFDIGGQSETVSLDVLEGTIQSGICVPSSLSELTGTLTITLYDNEMNQLCQSEFEVE